MNHDYPEIDNNQFDDFILFCLQTSRNRLNHPDHVKSVILYHVFFYSLFKSGILFRQENFSDHEAVFSTKTYPEKFSIYEIDDIREYFVPEIYTRLTALINLYLSKIPLHLLGGFFYEKLLGRKIGDTIIRDKQDKKNNGIFYTPRSTAEAFIQGLFDHYVKENKEIPEINILDLACGCGIFSIIALQKLTEIYLSKIANKVMDEPESHVRTSDEDYRNHATLVKLSILKNNLFAMDRDETALEIARYSLLLFCLMGEKDIISISRFSTMCATLETNLQKKDIIQLYKKRPLDDRDVYEKKYNIVFSNPPYIAYYSRHSKLSQPLEQDLPVMKENLLFSGFENKTRKKIGRYNSLMFFLDYAVRVSSPGSYLAFLIDMNIHESLFTGLRNWMLDNLTLLKTQINISDFPGVQSGQSFLYLQNKKHSEGHEVVIEDHQSREILHIQQTTLKENSAFYIRKNTRLLDQLDQLPRLGNMCRISTGVNIGGASNHFLSDKNNGVNFYPFIASLDLKNPYELMIDLERVYIHYDKAKADSLNKEYQTQGKKNILALGQLKRFLEPKIFVRQSAPRLIAGYCQEAVVSPYSVFVINQSGEYNLFVLLGILNSDLISYYSVKKGLIRQGLGKQPQIRKSSLQAIPVPDLQSYHNFKDKIIHHVQEILRVFCLQKKEAQGQVNRNIRERKEEIEKLVCSMYEVDYELFKTEKKLVL